MICDLRAQPSGKFENFSRITSSDFQFLLEKIEPKMLEFSINELKKKEALFSIYHYVRTKYVKSKKSGSGASEIEEPNWFASVGKEENMAS